MLIYGVNGCATVLGLEEPGAPEQRERYETTVVPGTTKRNELHQELGTPLVSSESWALDVFRSDFDDLYGVWVWVVLPMPAGYSILNDKAYLFVTYETSGVVSDFGTNVFMETGDTYRDGFKLSQATDAMADDMILRVVSTYEFDPLHEWVMASMAQSVSMLSVRPNAGRCHLYLAPSGAGNRILAGRRRRHPCSSDPSAWLVFLQGPVRARDRLRHGPCTVCNH